MENILTHLDADNLEIKLTDERLFINTTTSNETFALRSVNGIGVVDLVEDYNKALTTWKSIRTRAIFFCLVAISCTILSLIITKVLIVFGALFIILYLISSIQSGEKPKLMSAVRIMMNGGNRDFQFDKTGIKSGNVAEFVALVESTLTAYHKNND
jgi:hypothetical protein